MSKPNINIEIQLDNDNEGWLNVGEFIALMNRLGVQDDWTFSIESDSCLYVRFHKNDEIE